MHFIEPHWLWIGGAACICLVALFVRAERKRRIALARFASSGPETTVAPPRRWLRHVLAILGVGLACIALARPVAGFRWEQTPRPGVDLMFAIDTSKSMLAADLRPDRLTRAKLAVADLVRSFDGERVGLIAFAGDAFVQAPMTVDRDVFLEALDALDTDVIPRGGTDIASAIRAAEQAMASEPDHHKLLVLISDGEDLAGDALVAARAAAAKGLTIDTVGVGSQQGALIELGSGHELVRDAAGQPVRSHLDEPMLRSLAQVTGGSYAPLGSDGRGLETLYASIAAKLPKTIAAGTAHKVFTERYQIPLALAIAALLAELMIGERRRRRVAQAIGLVLLVLPQVASADPRTYNAGTAAYRKGDFKAAEQQFESALHTTDVRLQTDAYYDLGDARYRAGQATLSKHDRDATIATWKQAIAAYDAALGITPWDYDAAYNRDIVARALAALEQQNKQDPPQPQNQQQQKKDQQRQGQQKKDPQGQGQQSKDQHGQGQRSNNQQGQGQQAKNQPSQGQQAKNEQGQGQQPKDEHGQGQQPKDEHGDRGSDAPDAAAHADHANAGSASADAKEQAAQSAADSARRAAGELTRGEAVQLLDSVAHDLKPMPIHGRATDGHPEPTPIKDW